MIRPFETYMHPPARQREKDVHSAACCHAQRSKKQECKEDRVFDAPAGISGEARPAGGVEGVHGFHQANGAQRTAVSGAFAA